MIVTALESAVSFSTLLMREDWKSSRNSVSFAAGEIIWSKFAPWTVDCLVSWITLTLISLLSSTVYKSNRSKFWTGDNYIRVARAWWYYVQCTLFGEGSWTLHGSWQKFYLQHFNYTLIIFFKSKFCQLYTIKCPRSIAKHRTQNT